MVRLAGLLHLAQHLRDGWGKPIQASTVDAAATLGGYYAAHALAAFDDMGTDPTTLHARAVLAWIQRTASTTFTKRDLHRALRQIPTAADLGPVLAEGFAGPGEYEGHEPGSPIVALQTLLRAQPPPTPAAPAYLLLGDDNGERCAHLRDLLAAELGTLDPGALRRRGLVVEVRHGRCDEAFPALMQQHRAADRPLLAVFDTWGSAVPFDLLRRVAGSRTGETIVTIQPGHFARFAADAEHYGDNVFGSALWRDVQQQPASNKVDYIQTEYRRTVRDAGFRFVLAFHLADEGGHLLHLVYGTNHLRGIEKMKDAMWAVDPVHGIGYRDPRDPNQQTLQIQLDPHTAPLRRLILDQLAGQPGRQATVEDLRAFTLHETIYKPTHTTRVARELLATNQVRQTTPDRLTGSSTIALATPLPPAC